MRRLFDQHVVGWDDVDKRRFLWIGMSKPDCNGDVVCCVAVGDGKETMQTNEELGTTVVVSFLEGWMATRSAEEGEEERDTRSVLYTSVFGRREVWLSSVLRASV